jgi:hypothetical protein
MVRALANGVLYFHEVPSQKNLRIHPTQPRRLHVWQHIALSFVISSLSFFSRTVLSCNIKQSKKINLVGKESGENDRVDAILAMALARKI